MFSVSILTDLMLLGLQSEKEQCIKNVWSYEWKVGSMSWTLKKWVFGYGGRKCVYCLEKCDELSESVAFGQKLKYSTDQNEPTWGPHENGFWSTSNSEMNITRKFEKVDEKWVICLVFMSLSWVMVLKLSKKCIFCNFVLTLARNLSR